VAHSFELTQDLELGIASKLRLSHDQEVTMGILDSLKSKLSGNNDKVNQGVDTAADVAGDKVPDHADKIDKGADTAKDAIDKLDD